ncbi:MAG: FlgD immunoglobulin-like domain containing protein [Candidatus Krumholzibacteriia bacterium]
MKTFAHLVLTVALALIAPVLGALPVHVQAASASARAGGATVSVHGYALGGGTRAEVLPDASVRFVDGEGRVFLVLTGEVDGLGPRVPRRLHAAVSREGAPGGARGFGLSADDDRDGRRDEDRLDGRDNDGDGRVDEDFAAVSDAMTVVTLNGAGRSLHLETYHWAYPSTQDMLAVVVTGAGLRGEPVGGAVQFEAAGTSWDQVDLPLRRLGPRGEFSVTTETVHMFALPAAADGRRVWVGVGLLEPEDARLLPEVRLRLQGSTLRIPMVEGRVQFAVVTAPTLLRLVAALAEARSVERGVRDPVTGETLAWIVPPSALATRLPQTPPARWSPDPDGGGKLAVRVTADATVLPDPDLFSLDDRILGTPHGLTWRPDDGVPTSLGWRAVTTADLDSLALPHTEPARLVDPFGALMGSALIADGWLELDYRAIPAAAAFAVPHPGMSARSTAGEGSAATDDGDGDGASRVAGTGDPGDAGARTAGLLCGRSIQGQPVRFELVAPDGSGAMAPAAVAEAAGPATEIGSDAPAASARRTGRGPSLSPALLENFPNPFRDQTTIRFTIPAIVGEGFVWEDGEAPGLDPAAQMPYAAEPPAVSVRVYDVSGEEVARLFVDRAGPGTYDAQWDGSDLYGRRVASGNYFVSLQVDAWNVTKSIVFVR